MSTSSKPMLIVLMEAVVVGIGLIAIVSVVEMFASNKYAVLFISGVIFHVAFEYTKLNEIYSIDYCTKYLNLK